MAANAAEGCVNLVVCNVPTFSSPLFLWARLQPGVARTNSMQRTQRSTVELIQPTNRASAHSPTALQPTSHPGNAHTICSYWHAGGPPTMYSATISRRSTPLPMRPAQPGTRCPVRRDLSSAAHVRCAIARRADDIGRRVSESALSHRTIY